MKDRIDKLMDQWSQQRPELDCSGLDVVARLQEIAKLLRRNENAALETLNLKMWEYDVLSALRRQGRPYQLPATELAYESLLTSGAMTHRIDRLASRGLVTRVTDPEDRRGILIRLTLTGRKLVDTAIEARLGIADLQLMQLTKQERQILASGLRKIVVLSS